MHALIHTPAICPNIQMMVVALSFDNKHVGTLVMFTSLVTLASHSGVVAVQYYEFLPYFITI